MDVPFAFHLFTFAFAPRRLAPGMDHRCHQCDATLEAEPGRGEWLECPARRRFIRLSGPPSGDVPTPVAGELPWAGPVEKVETVFTVLWVISIAVAVLGLPALFIYGSERELVMIAGVALGCSLHFAFLWAVLHLLSGMRRLLKRLVEQREGEGKR